MPIEPRILRVAEHYSPDLTALGAESVVPKQAGILVVAPDAQRGSTLAALLASSPHDVRMQVATAAGAAVEPAHLDPAAVADTLAGARLAGTTAVSWSEQGVQSGMRIPSLVNLYVADAQRAADLRELLTLRAGAPAGDLTAGVPLRVTTDPVPQDGGIRHVRRIDA